MQPTKLNRSNDFRFFLSLNFFSLLFPVNTDRVCILVNFSFWFAPNLWCNIIKSVLLTTEYFPNSLLVWSHYVCRMKSSLIFVSVHATNKFLVWAFCRCALTKLAQNISNFQWLVLSNRKSRNDVLMLRHTRNRFSQFNTLFCALTLPKIAAYIETLNSTFR